MNTNQMYRIIAKRLLINGNKQALDALVAAYERTDRDEELVRHMLAKIILPNSSDEVVEAFANTLRR